MALQLIYFIEKTPRPDTLKCSQVNNTTINVFYQ
jgi:hypothetical protein